MIGRTDSIASREKAIPARIQSRFIEFVGDPAIICLLLAMVTLALYWPAARFQFINDDDPGNFARNPHVQGGLCWEGFLWALEVAGVEQLVSGDLAFFHVRRHVVWRRPVGPAPDKYPASHCEQLPTILVVATAYGGALAERPGGGIVCHSSVERRIGGLGFGTQECFEHVLLAADAAGVRALRAMGDK